MSAHIEFPLLDRYMGVRMEVDLARLRPGQVFVVESARRLKREQSYGYIHALWWIWLVDGRSAVSVPPGAGDNVGQVMGSVQCAKGMEREDVIEPLQLAVDEMLVEAGMKRTDRVLSGSMFACNASLLRRHHHGHCQQLVDERIPPAKGLRLPTHCFPDGIVYGVIADGQVVSMAHAHRPGLMEDQVADLGGVTAPGYRRRGYAQTGVSAVVAYITQAGGEARYGCSPGNRASIATARSVGFVPYGSSLILAAPACT